MIEPVRHGNRQSLLIDLLMCFAHAQFLSLIELYYNLAYWRVITYLSYDSTWFVSFYFETVLELVFPDSELTTYFTVNVTC